MVANTGIDGAFTVRGDDIILFCHGSVHVVSGKVSPIALPILLPPPSSPPPPPTYIHRSPEVDGDGRIVVCQLPFDDIECAVHHFAAVELPSLCVLSCPLSVHGAALYANLRQHVSATVAYLKMCSSCSSVPADGRARPSLRLRWCVSLPSTAARPR